MPHSNEALQALVVAMNAVLHEIKTLTRKVENVGDTMASHVTQLALIEQRDDNRKTVIDALAMRIKALEDQRDELTKTILAKTVAAALFLSTVVAAAAAYLMRR